MRCEGLVGLVVCAVVAQAMGAGDPGAAAPAPPPRAVDIADEVGIAEDTQTFSANVADYDRDGWDDVLLVRHRFGDARLYHNDGGTFTEVAVGTFPASVGAGHDRHDCAWADVNQDRLTDVFCSVGADAGTATDKANEMWMQTSPGVFEDKGEEYEVIDPYGRGRSSTFLDVNHDAWPDLFIGNEAVRKDAQVSNNRLLLNDGGVRFVDSDYGELEQQLGSRTIQAADYDRDGWEDLLICAENGVRLYRNVEGIAFDDVSAETGILRPCRAARLADLNGDRQLDLIAGSEDQLSISLQRNGDFYSVDHQRAVDRVNDLAAGDFDGDGDRDIYLQLSPPRLGNTPDLLLLNEGSGHAWVEQPMPTTTEGVGDRVVAIDSDRDGRDEFLVLNGRGATPGPIQLIAAPGKAPENQ